MKFVVASGEHLQDWLGLASLLWPNVGQEDLRQLFAETLHPELIQVDLRQLGAEFSSRRGKKLNVCRPNGGLIRKWIRKCENFAPRHFRSPGLPEAEKIGQSR